MMKEGLSLLCKTGNGLAHAYVKLEVKERDLTDIHLLSSYIHLRYVDISENHLTDLSPLNYLTHLLWLKADGNQLRSAQLNELPYLQIASFAYNQITDTEGISHPRLGSLDLKGNLIHTVTGLDPRKLISLHTLELRGNQLNSTLGINLPKLKKLYLAQNMLKKVEGLENLSNLTTLHLRDNQIETLSGFSGDMKSLQYLNLRRARPWPQDLRRFPVRGATTFTVLIQKQRMPSLAPAQGTHHSLPPRFWEGCLGSGAGGPGPCVEPRQGQHCWEPGLHGLGRDGGRIPAELAAEGLRRQRARVM
ncbi:leucine-rich repeat-containing protein 23 isoform X3 [Manis javanica]|nr:leucine-rich repeat-containing protein 23 isoform X3 [Manis javanica]